MGKKKKKKIDETVSVEEKEIIEPSEEITKEDTAPEEAEELDTEETEEITLSDETLEEIGTPDKDLMFLKVAKAYEEAKQSRKKFKKIGPAFVFISAVVFLALMFTLDYKISFLILWVATDLFTAALMIRAEYRYSRFRDYLGLKDEESETEEEIGEEAETDLKDDNTGEEQDALPEEPKDDTSTEESQEDKE